MESSKDALGAERAWVAQRTWPNQLAMPTFTVRALFNDSALASLRELLSSVHSLNKNDYENLEIAARKLPQWFLDQSPKQLNRTEADQWIRKWTSASISQKKDMQIQLGWSPPDWLYWLVPENRLWYLVESSSEASTMTFSSYELMALNGAGEWMLQICGINVLP